MDGEERTNLHRWFLPQLAEAWDERSSGVGQVDDDRYVQWAGYRLGLQIECVSNRHLSGAARLTPAEVDRLRRLGWQDPLGEDLPNFWQSFFDRADLPAAATALVDAVSVLRGEAPLQGRDSAPPPARVVVVVPVMKVDHATVLTALHAGLSLLPEALVIDLLGEALPGSALLGGSPPSGAPWDDAPGEQPSPPVTQVSAVLEAGQYLQYPLLADPGVSFSGGPADEAMTAAGHLLGQLRQLKAAGRSVVLVGPRLLPGDEWLYAASLQVAADAVVCCVPGMDDGGLSAQMLTAVRSALQAVPRLVTAATPRPSDRLLAALAGVDAVVASRSAGLRRDTLGAVLGARWGTPVDHAGRGRVLDAVVKARLLPLAGRLLTLPEVLRTSRDAEEAVDLLLAAVSLGQQYPAQLRRAGAAWAQVLMPLCSRLADAGRRGVDLQRAAAPLEWLVRRGGDHDQAARSALACVALDDAGPLAWCDHGVPDDRKPKRQQVPTAPLVRQRRDSQSAGEGSREATAAGEQAAWIPPHSFASDIDGDRHIIVLADDADMDGWSVATTRGTWRLKPTTVWGSDSPNFLGIGTPARAWVAPCDHGELIRFLPPGA